MEEEEQITLKHIENKESIIKLETSKTIYTSTVYTKHSSKIVPWHCRFAPWNDFTGIM